jgi:hypothetical protein
MRVKPKQGLSCLSLRDTLLKAPLKATSWDTQLTSHQPLSVHCLDCLDCLECVGERRQRNSPVASSREEVLGLMPGVNQSTALVHKFQLFSSVLAVVTPEAWDKQTRVWVR